MAVANKAPEFVADALTAKAGKKIWDSLSPEAKRRIIKTNAGIISADMARQASREPKNWVIAGTVALGVAAGVYALLRRNNKK